MKQLLIFFVLVMNSGYAIGQKIKRFEDKYGLQGTIAYQGSWSDSILPSSGSYELKWRELKADTIFTYLAKGQLKQHLPEGIWRWEQASLHFDISPGQTVKPQFNSFGKYEIWTGTFHKGIPQKRWLYALGNENMSPNGQGAEIKIEAELLDGRLIRNFKVTDLNRKVEISGYANFEGIAEKTWVFTYETNEGKLVEKRSYDRGILIVKEIFNEEGLVNKKIFEDQIAHLLNLKNTEGKIKIGEKTFIHDAEKNTAMELYEQYLYGYFSKGWVLEKFPHDVSLSTPTFRQLEYPLSTQELDQLESIQKSIDSLRNAFETRFNYGNLSLIRGRSDRIDLAVAFLEHANQRLFLIDSLLVFTSDDSFTYLDRSSGALLPWLKKINQDTYFEGEIYREKTDSLFSISENLYANLVIEGILASMKHLEKQSTAYLLQVDRSMSNIKRESQLKEIEDKLAGDLIKIDSAYSGKAGIAAWVLRKWGKDFMKEQLILYSQLNDVEEAKGFANSLQSKIDSLLDWSDQWMRLDDIQNTLRKGYVSMVMNPFTGKYDMELKLKPRFLKHVEEILLPYMFEDIVSANNWEDFCRKRQELYKIKNGLLEFALEDDKNAQKIERRMRKEQSGERMLKLFLSYLDKR